MEPPRCCRRASALNATEPVAGDEAVHAALPHGIHIVDGSFYRISYTGLYTGKGTRFSMV